jgi:hypothetical protein
MFVIFYSKQVNAKSLTPVLADFYEIAGCEEEAKETYSKLCADAEIVCAGVGVISKGTEPQWVEL